MKKYICKIFSSKAIFFVILQVIFVILFKTNTYAVHDANSIYSGTGAAGLNRVFSGILWIIIAVGMVSGIIMIAIIGVKYIWESPEGKADLKKQAIPFLVGAVLLIGGSTLVKFAINVASSLN